MILKINGFSPLIYIYVPMFSSQDIVKKGKKLLRYKKNI